MLKETTGFKHIYVRCGYTDLRKGIDSLAAIIKNDFELDPFEQGNLFLFCGRRPDRIKGLTYEGDGFLLLYKRVADGKFQWPRSPDEVQNISEQQFRWLMDGLAIEQKKTIKEVKPKLL